MSRKAGGTSQLFNYLFRYMLNEEKAGKISEKLQPLVKEVQKHTSAKEFEKELQEQGILQYHGTQIDFAGTPNTHSNNYGNLGNGFYLSKEIADAKKFAKQSGVVKKYIVDNKIKLFESGKRNVEYNRLLKQLSVSTKNPTSVNELHDKVREYLEKQGYAGINTTKQTMVYHSKTITELPKDFFRQAKQAKGKTTDLKQSQLVIRHNIHSRSIPGYIKEFERNEALRIHKRKDSVQVYHTILSFSNKDKEHVNEKVLTDMARKYIELRGTNNLYVITSHHDHDHIHLHCAQSGTQLNGISSRVSRNEFAKIKLELDRYQKEKYPELVNSLPRHGKAKQVKDIEVEKNIKRNERSKDKNSLMQVLETAYNKSTSREQFFTHLESLGHTPYYRAGTFAGLKYDGHRKFRINRLGYDEMKLMQLDERAKEEKQLKEIQELRTGKNRIQEIQNDLPLKELPNTDPIQNRLFELDELRNSSNMEQDNTERSIEDDRQDDSEEPEVDSLTDDTETNDTETDDGDSDSDDSGDAD